MPELAIGLTTGDKPIVLRVREDGAGAGAPLQVETPRSSAATSTALAAAQVLKNGAGFFFAADCEIDPSAPTGVYYVLLVDAAAAPADGPVTLLRAVGVDHQQGARDYVSISEEQGGVAVAAGVVVCLSSTRPALASAGAYLWADGRVG